MSTRRWLGIGAAAVGALALMTLIWWGGPFLSVAGVRPLDGFWSRFAICGGIALLVGGAIGFDVYRRRRAAKAIESALGAQDDESSDAGVLQEGMRDALATLRKARGKNADYLYELPWYIIIGPPGAGKTTALVNSGFKFPLARGGAPEAIAGIGGTRYCDWWFTEDAVLIDTAGRYTTQDSDPKGDRTSWLAFLDLLARHRPKQPINGAIIAISLEDLLTGSPEELNGHAVAIRKRLLELHDKLQVDFPVYALFTKADLLAGFLEFFGHLPEAERRMVWGHTFQTSDKTQNRIGDVPAEFDALVERLNQWLPDRLQDEPSPSARVVLFGFPSQVAAVKKHVGDFLNRIFEPSRYHVNATLRGFYFASGTQNGTPIDQLIGSLSRSFGSQDVAAAVYSGRGRSFFLSDLMKKVVVGEAGWVSTNRAAIRRGNVVRLAAYGTLAVASATLVGLWWTSYLRNTQAVDLSNALLGKYRGEATETLREAVVADRNYSKVLPLLNTLRYMPSGYASRSAAVPVLATFGLSQHDRLRSAAETAYRLGLERMFRPRLIFRMEEQLEANKGNASFVYEALKVYMMLGSRPEAPPDRNLIVAWMRRDWTENLFPGAGLARGRQLLEDHLVAMLDLEDGSPLLVSVNGLLVEDSQRALARLSVAERAYELLKSQARPATARDWAAAKAGGADSSLVFEASGSGDLDTVRVPFFFTYAGFFEAFIDRFGDIAEVTERDRWVLGAAGQQQAYTAQYGSLFTDLLKLYARDFVPAWTGALGRLKLRPLASDPRFVALQAISAPTSPLKQIVESLRDETRLTRERPPGPGGRAGAAGEGSPGRAALDAAGREAAIKAAGALPGAAASATATALGGLTGGGGGPAPRDRFAVPASEAPGSNIEAAFKSFHMLLDGDPGRRTIDAVILNLNEIKNAAVEATNPAQAAQASNNLVTQTRALRALAARLPAPFEPMMRQVANEFEGKATGAAVTQIAQSLGDQVTRDCREIVTNRYPFFKGSEREVALADFARLFAPGGTIDRFFAQHLASRVDRSQAQWTWRQDDGVARSLSQASLREFQRADEIRKAFFSTTGGAMPAITFAVTPLTLTGDAARARFEINGSAVATQQGVNTPAQVTWPGAGVGRTTISIEGATGFFGGKSPSTLLLEKDGTWSLFRLLDSGSVLAQGDAVVATFVAGGREMSYRFNASTGQNPLTLPALREFRCPTGI